MWLAQPAAVTKPEFPWLAGVGPWVRLAKRPGMPSWVTGHRSLQSPLSPKDGDSACCAPRVVALGDTAATKASQEPWARLNKRIQANLSFQKGNFSLLPCQKSSWGCDPLLAMDERGENLTWRGR